MPNEPRPHPLAPATQLTTLGLEHSASCLPELVERATREQLAATAFLALVLTRQLEAVPRSGMQPERAVSRAAVGDKPPNVSTRCSNVIRRVTPTSELR